MVLKQTTISAFSTKEAKYGPFLKGLNIDCVNVEMRHGKDTDQCQLNHNVAKVSFVFMIMISDIYTGLLVQDKDPVISQGPVERKGMK